ncbi:CCA tRNA nucleotidyltransferase [Candidatus Woesearchaeota archaeon]|nr:CCA tRNA nucleotidyltransferase [Candidatus Woesearchaeota archaeon]
MKTMLSEVIKEIVPDKKYEDEILKKASDIIKKINSGMKDAKATLAGSGAKGTWLKSFDADIFVRFSYNKFRDRSQELSDILEKFLKKHYKIIRLHGSRDYFQIKEGKFTFEIVPILDIKKAEQAKNITDVSPLHSDFVLKHKKLKDEIRLAKQFFKAARVYGAESHIMGFSGYVCELLTIHYGSFLALIRAMPKWKEKTVIDIKNYYRGKSVFSEINKSKLNSPIIVIDPVQKDRNAAAALDHEKFEIIKHRSMEFLKNPSKEFFEVKNLAEQDIRKEFGSNLVMLKASPLRKKVDVAGAKMLKAFHYIENELLRHGFKVKESDMLWHAQDSLFYYALQSDKLPVMAEITGPPAKAEKHALAFRKKHKKAFVKGKRLFAIEKRKFADAKNLVRELIKASNVRSNVSSIRLV